MSSTPSRKYVYFERKSADRVRYYNNMHIVALHREWICMCPMPFHACARFIHAVDSFIHLKKGGQSKGYEPSPPPFTPLLPLLNILPYSRTTITHPWDFLPLYIDYFAPAFPCDDLLCPR